MYTIWQGKKESAVEESLKKLWPREFGDEFPGFENATITLDLNENYVWEFGHGRSLNEICLRDKHWFIVTISNTYKFPTEDIARKTHDERVQRAEDPSYEEVMGEVLPLRS